MTVSGITQVMRKSVISVRTVKTLQFTGKPFWDTGMLVFTLKAFVILELSLFLVFSVC